MLYSSGKTQAPKQAIKSLILECEYDLRRATTAGVREMGGDGKSSNI